MNVRTFALTSHITHTPPGRTAPAQRLTDGLVGRIVDTTCARLRFTHALTHLPLTHSLTQATVAAADDDVAWRLSRPVHNVCTFMASVQRIHARTHIETTNRRGVNVNKALCYTWCAPSTCSATYIRTFTMCKRRAAYAKYNANRCYESVMLYANTYILHVRACCEYCIMLRTTYKFQADRSVSDMLAVNIVRD